MTDTNQSVIQIYEQSSRLSNNLVLANALSKTPIETPYWKPTMNQSVIQIHEQSSRVQLPAEEMLGYDPFYNPPTTNDVYSTMSTFYPSQTYHKLMLCLVFIILVFAGIFLNLDYDKRSVDSNPKTFPYYQHVPYSIPQTNPACTSAIPKIDLTSVNAAYETKATQAIGILTRALLPNVTGRVKKI